MKPTLLCPLDGNYVYPSTTLFLSIVLTYTAKHSTAPHNKNFSEYEVASPAPSGCELELEESCATATDACRQPHINTTALNVCKYINHLKKGFVNDVKSQESAGGLFYGAVSINTVSL
jgi:hypothetical protein